MLQWPVLMKLTICSWIIPLIYLSLLQTIGGLPPSIKIGKSTGKLFSWLSYPIEYYWLRFKVVDAVLCAGESEFTLNQPFDTEYKCTLCGGDVWPQTGCDPVKLSATVAASRRICRLESVVVCSLVIYYVYIVVCLPCRDATIEEFICKHRQMSKQFCSLGRFGYVTVLFVTAMHPIMNCMVVFPCMSAHINTISRNRLVKTRPLQYLLLFKNHPVSIANIEVIGVRYASLVLPLARFVSKTSFR
jgi:hypothetical protein